MKLRLFFILIGIAALSLPAFAQTAAPETGAISPYTYKIPQKPDIDGSKSLEELSREKPAEKFTSKRTDNMTVAMLFYKITGQKPDFFSWAKLSKSWQDAPPAQQSLIAAEIVKKLNTQFTLMGFDEPIHIETVATLSQYAPENEGFFIEEFKEDTYYTYGFNGDYYAVIPSDILDYKWIKMPVAKMEALASHITDKNQLYMRLSLIPIMGDAKQKVPLSNGHDNWLMATKVLDIELYSPKDKTLLWRSNEGFYRRKNELLNLYQ